MPTLTDPDADEKYAPKVTPGEHHDGLEQKFAAPDSSQVADLERQFASPAATESGSQKLAQSKELSSQETSASSSDNPMNFTGGKSVENGKQKKEVKGFWNKKRASIAGGVTGVGLLGGLLGFSFLSGPLQFIHIAHLLHDSHFSQQENASNGRFGKMLRYFKKNMDPGQTRLTWIGSKYNNRILAKVRAIGIDPDFNGVAGAYERVIIDTNNEQNPYHGMSEEEKAKAIQSDFGGKVAKIADGKYAVLAKNKYGFRSQALKGVAKSLKGGKLSYAARIRTLKKYGFVSWHPLKKLDYKVNTTARAIFDKYKKKWTDRLKSGKESVTVDSSKAKNDEGTDKNGNQKTSTASDGEKTIAADAPGNSKGILGKLAETKSAKLAGGVAAVAGLACALKAVGDNIGAIKYAQVIVPMIRVGMNVITVGNQIESGQDVDPNELSYLSHFFNSPGDSTKNVQPTNWSDSLPIRANNGETGGIDISQGIKSSLKQGRPSWLDWTDNPFMKGLCSTVGSILTGVFSGVLGVISGGAVSTAVGFIVSSVATGPIIKYVSGLLAGDALDIASLAGAEWGSVADYGARLGANAGALQMGGTALSPVQAAQVDAQAEQQQQNQFESQSFFARMFSPYNYRSLFSRLIDSQSTSITADLTSVTNGLDNYGSSLIKLPFSLFASTTHAATVQPYQYPFPEYGFSVQDLNNTLVDDPYANANAVAALLNSSNGSSYISKAKSCFGVNLTKGDQGWDVIPEKDINVYDNSYDKSGCADSSDQNWLRIRFFILDTSTMEGYACAEFNDPTSCANDGFDTGQSTGSSQTPTTPTTPGTYKNPLRDLKNLYPERIDGGVDYNANDGPIYSVGDGVVKLVQTGASSGWPGNPGAYIMYELTDGPAQGKYIYMAEDCTPTVKVGETLTADTEICSYHYTGTAMEMGWSDGTNNYATSDYRSHGGGSYASNTGLNFSQFLVSLGAPPGKIEGSKSTVPMPAGWPTWQ